MEQQLYERPREKIRARGASSLSRTELLQVIIGSGSKKYTVAKLARAVNDALRTGEGVDLYNTLNSIPGVGDATACKIIAALYLNKVHDSTNGSPHQVIDIHKFILHKHQKVHCISLDGEQNILNSHSWLTKDRKTTSLLAKQLFSKALLDNAHSVVVLIGCQKQSLESSMFELSLLNDLRELSIIVQVKLQSLVIANKSNALYLYGGPNDRKRP